VVARSAARAPVVVVVTITSTFRPTSSASSVEFLSSLPPAKRYSMMTFCPSTQPRSRSLSRKAATRCWIDPGGAGLRKPIRHTVLACWASAASGAARSPATVVRKIRRSIMGHLPVGQVARLKRGGQCGHCRLGSAMRQTRYCN